MQKRNQLIKSSQNVSCDHDNFMRFFSGMDDSFLYGKEARIKDNTALTILTVGGLRFDRRVWMVFSMDKDSNGRR